MRHFVSIIRTTFKLWKQGANLIFFSPLNDNLPDAGAIYLEGRYPGLHASELQAAKATSHIRSETLNGMQIYAECGGLNYRTRNITISSDMVKVVGVLPAHRI